MQSSNKILVSLAAVLVGISTEMAGGVAAPTSAPSGGQPVMGTWQHHHVNFNYNGITALYSCDGLESNIRALLLHFGARKDANVKAIGCPNGPSVPGRNAIIGADFYTLSPSSGTSDAVAAQWASVVVSPTQPFFMGNGDCELINEMKDLITKNFSLREVAYRADCFPHEITVNDFSVKAQVLKALPVAGAGTGKD